MKFKWLKLLGTKNPNKTVKNKRNIKANRSNYREENIPEKAEDKVLRESGGQDISAI